MFAAEAWAEAVNIEDIFVHRQHVRAKAAILSKDGETSQVHCLLSGVCAGYDLLADGRRQIISLYLPGEVLGADVLSREGGGRHVVAMSDAVIGSVSRRELRTLVAENAAVNDLFTRQLVKSHAMLEVWVSALGRRSAMERIAMFFCEVLARMHAIGLAEQDTCHLPLNQVDLADIVGLSVVHVNRVLKSMRDMELATFEGGRLDVHARARLESIAEFDPDYLRL